MNRVTVNREMCKECEYCMTFCPKKTILVKSKNLIEAQNMKDCIACGICAAVCPEGSIMVEKDI